MSSENPRPLLERWYANKFGEPRFPEEAYGYWIFVAGAVLGLLGFVVFLVNTTAARGDPLFWSTRQAAAVLAGAGLPILMLGVVYRLPVKRRVDRVAIAGVLACLVALGAFAVYYPGNWNVPATSAAPDYSTQIATAYAAGFVFVVFSALVLPAVTAVREEVAVSAPEESKANFELFRDRADEWRWRLVHRNGNIIADSGEGYASKQKAKQGLESVRKNAGGASVKEEKREKAVGTQQRESVEGSPSEAVLARGETADETSEPRARYELYEDASGDWRWRLVHDNGNILADSGQGYASKQKAKQGLDSVRNNVADADHLKVTPAGFEVFRDSAGEWRWRLVHSNGRVIADSGEGYAERNNAAEAVERIRSTEVLAAEFEVYEDASGDWRWRLVHDNGNILADSAEGYRSEADARTAADRVADYVPEADTVQVGDAYFGVFRDSADEWRWRLVHRNGNIIADSGEGYTERNDAVEALKRVKVHGSDGSVTELDE